MRGEGPISTLYARIFAGPGRVNVTLHNISAYASPAMVVFAGRERGTYERDGNAFPLAIRTTRIFVYAPAQGGWRHSHHHGSIDDAAHLAAYQQVVLGAQAPGL